MPHSDRCSLQAAAEASLELHKKELEGGLKLQVAISDPTAKKSRTDIGANQKELHIAGLSKFVKEFDLRRLFEKVRTLLLRGRG